MSITNLEAALLSFDAYNRGFNAAFSDNGSRDDDDGLGQAGAQIGDATVLDVDLPSGSESAGFYAVAYELNGQTVL